MGAALVFAGWMSVLAYLGYLAWQDGGEHEVKNIARPVHVWHWTPEAWGIADRLALVIKDAVIVTPHFGQCSKHEIRSQTVSGGEAMASEERRAGISPMLARAQCNRGQIRRFAETHRYSFRDQC